MAVGQRGSRKAVTLAAAVSIAVAAFVAGRQWQDRDSDVDRVVSQAVNSHPSTADASIETLRRTNQAVELSLKTIAANISNAQTTGYKAGRLHHRGDGHVDLLLDTQQGSMESTNRPLDIGIQGPGFIPIRKESWADGLSYYTRNGNLFRNSEGDLILNVGEGYQLIPPINIPFDVPDQNISIDTYGQVSYIRPGTTVKTLAGQIQLASFTNPQVLKQDRAGVYRHAPEAGKPQVGNPTDNGTGAVFSGFLEASNVDLPSEEVRRIAALRWQASIDRAIAKAAK